MYPIEDDQIEMKGQETRSDYRLRDYLVGWLANHLQRDVLTREEVEALYDIVTDAETDAVALAELHPRLGRTMIHKLETLSQQWHDPTVETARAMIEALRDQVQEDYHDLPDFYHFFLNPFKEGCVPEGYEENLEREIIWMFRTLYTAAAAEVLASYGWEVDVVVEPSYEDASYIVILAYPKGEMQYRAFLLDRRHKAWQVQYANLGELAQELLTIRQMVERPVQEIVLGYHLVQTIREVMGQPDNVFAENPTEETGNSITARVTIEVHGGVATVVEKPAHIAVNIIDFDTGLAHL